MKNLFTIFRRRAPKISVCLPVYNTKPEHLQKCIESILGQTFRDFELLILNDSPDNRELDKIVRSYKDPRIVYRKSKKNLDIYGARNYLLDMSRGEYIAVHDHDDISMPERFEKQVAFLDANPNYGAVSSFWYANDNREYYYYFPEGNVDIKKGLMEDCAFQHTACMMRKSVLDRHALRYEAAYCRAEDYYLFMRLAEVTLLHTMPEVLVSRNFHDTNISILHQQRTDALRGEISFQMKNRFPFTALESQLTVLQNKIDELSQKVDALGGK